MFRLTSDSGLAMVLIAVLLVMLLGMVAFAVDTAAIYQERRELQNGADAAVLAIAEDCGRGTKPCDTPTATATADAYADDNAGDDRAQIDSLVLDTAAQTIEVTTLTETSEGGSILKPFFAQVIGFAGADVHATAKAVYGQPAGANDIPLTISKCEWDKIATTTGPLDNLGDGEEFYEDWADEYGPPTVGGFTITFHEGNTTEDCNAEAGHDRDGDERLPGGFGWLMQAEAGCTATTDEDGWYEADPGADAPSPACPADTVAGYLGHIIFVPVFIDFEGPPSFTPERYEMNGYAALYLTGYKFSGSPTWTRSLSGEDPCSGSTRCIQGYLTEGTCWDCPVIPSGGGNYYGVLAIKLIA